MIHDWWVVSRAPLVVRRPALDNSDLEKDMISYSGLSPTAPSQRIKMGSRWMQFTVMDGSGWQMYFRAADRLPGRLL